jgi:AcrR family transcriptional regulator
MTTTGDLSEARQPRRRRAPQKRSILKRARIVDTAMQHFAQRGYEGARVEDMAHELQIAKGSIFQHFKTKEGLFLEVYKKSVRDLGRFLDVPAEVRAGGFLAIVRYWLDWTSRLIQRDWIPFRVMQIGFYGTDLSVKRDITRYLREEDPAGVAEFIRYGIERGEVREDIDPELLGFMVCWLTDRFADAMVSEELDPGLFGDGRERPARVAAAIEQFTRMIQDAVRPKRQGT